MIYRETYGRSERREKERFLNEDATKKTGRRTRPTFRFGVNIAYYP